MFRKSKLDHSCQWFWMLYFTNVIKVSVLDLFTPYTVTGGNSRNAFEMSSQIDLLLKTFTVQCFVGISITFQEQIWIKCTKLGAEEILHS